jgi:quercetin dioxygenase-like cupin family protein
MERNKTSRTTPDSASDDGSISRREVLALLGMLGLGGSIEAVAQDAAKVLPRSYRVLLENDKVRVLEYRSLPGLGVCGQGKHSHPAHLSIVMADGRAKVVDDSGKVHSHDAKAGDVFWAPAETHSVENISGRTMRAYMVEFKDKDWAPSTG